MPMKNKTVNGLSLKCKISRNVPSENILIHCTSGCIVGILLGGLRLDLSYLDSFFIAICSARVGSHCISMQKEKEKTEKNRSFCINLHISKGNLQRTFWKVVLRMSFVMVIRFNFA